MGMLDNLKADEKVEAVKDVIGGGYSPLSTAIYPFKIEMAHIVVSDGGSTGMALTMKTQDDKQLRTTVYMTSGTAKGGKPYYTKDGKNYPLPGFTLINDLSQIITGKAISDLEPVDKVIKMYNYEAQAEVPTPVKVVEELLDQEIYGAVFHQIVNKNVKGDDGKYHPTVETREENEIAKFFRSNDKMTVPEIEAGATEATFYNTWDAKWTGNTRNKVKGLAGAAGAPQATTAKPAAGAPTQSLFG